MVNNKPIPKMKARQMKLDQSFSGTLFDILNYAFIAFFCVTILFPVWDMLVVSVSDPKDISLMNLNLYPKNFTWDSYKFCLRDDALFVAFGNSVARTVLGTVWHLLVCCLAAYTMTRTGMPLLKPVTILFLITMFFGGGLIPSYLNIKNLGLLDNFWVYVVPAGFSMYNTIIIRNYFFSIDKSMEESATIDGASMVQVMFLIILPLSKPVLATVGLWQMVGQWNSWFDNMIYCRSDSLITLQYMLKKLQNDVAAMTDEAAKFAAVTEQTVVYTSETVIACATTITVVPIIIVYPFLQKYFVKGIMLGAVKG